MEYQETGRLGRITKNLRKQGFEKGMENILYDSSKFPKLKKPEQTKYVETVMIRMIENIGVECTEKVLFECGAKCCGKSWVKFVKGIWDVSNSLDDFFVNLNTEEKKYNTTIDYNLTAQSITVERNKCICGLINKGEHFTDNISYCKCSNGHMSEFFNSVFSVKEVKLEESIYSGADTCRWTVQLDNKA